MNTIHPINPIYNSESRILILGSFPSVKSRESCFFYHHPQNRFWKVISTICSCPLPETIEEKTLFLLENRIALWDVIHSCEIKNSSDSSIKNASVNDFSVILNSAKIKKIFTNGNKAHSLYIKYCEAKTGIKDTCLPSTSPANAAYSLDRLCEHWNEIKKYL